MANILDFMENNDPLTDHNEQYVAEDDPEWLKIAKSSGQHQVAQARNLNYMRTNASIRSPFAPPVTDASLQSRGEQKYITYDQHFFFPNLDTDFCQFEPVADICGNDIKAWVLYHQKRSGFVGSPMAYESTPANRPRDGRTAMGDGCFIASHAFQDDPYHSLHGFIEDIGKRIRALKNQPNYAAYLHWLETTQINHSTGHLHGGEPKHVVKRTRVFGGVGVPQGGAGAAGGASQSGGGADPGPKRQRVESAAEMEARLMEEVRRAREAEAAREQEERERVQREQEEERLRQEASEENERLLRIQQLQMQLEQLRK